MICVPDGLIHSYIAGLPGVWFAHNWPDQCAFLDKVRPKTERTENKHRERSNGLYDGSESRMSHNNHRSSKGCYKCFTDPICISKLMTSKVNRIRFHVVYMLNRIRSVWHHKSKILRFKLAITEENIETFLAKKKRPTATKPVCVPGSLYVTYMLSAPLVMFCIHLISNVLLPHLLFSLCSSILDGSN